MTTLVMDNDNHEYDAFNAMFNRGAYLRKLREMEAEFDKEAAETEDLTANTDGDTLHYESNYLAGQHYYDDYKHVNYQFIDFGVPLTNVDKENADTNTTEQQQSEPQQQQPAPLLIEQDRTVGKGGFVWDAGFILAEHILHEQEEWKPLVKTATTAGKNIRMVELGAGTGVTGLMVASAMPNVHASLTDLPELMPLLQKNLVHNPTAKATAFPLAWGTDVTGDYDVILGADVVAGIYDPVKLAKTICDLCHENTLVYLAVNSRLYEIIATFEEAMGELFESVEHRVPVSRNKNPNVSILVATKKR